MRIKVDETWFIEPATQGGYDLIETRVSENDKPYELNHGYNMSMSRCIKKLAHLNICSIDEEVSLGQFLGLYKEVVSEIEKLVSV